MEDDNNYLCKVAKKLDIKVNNRILNVMRDLIDSKISLNDLIIIMEEMRIEAEN